MKKKLKLFPNSKETDILIETPHREVNPKLKVFQK